VILKTLPPLPRLPPFWLMLDEDEPTPQADGPPASQKAAASLTDDECSTCPTELERPTAEAETEQPLDADPWAEGVAQLQSMPPLPGFEAGRWRLVLLDCRALLELWGSEMRRLGWKTEDGFGINPRAPGASVNCYGLGVLLKGGKVVEMTATGAKVQCMSGVHQSFVRPRGSGAVPIWTVGNQGGECARSPHHCYDTSPQEMIRP